MEPCLQKKIIIIIAEKTCARPLSHRTRINDGRRPPEIGKGGSLRSNEKGVSLFFVCVIVHDGGDGDERYYEVHHTLSTRMAIRSTTHVVCPFHSNGVRKIQRYSWHNPSVPAVACRQSARAVPAGVDTVYYSTTEQAGHHLYAGA